MSGRNETGAEPEYRYRVVGRHASNEPTDSPTVLESWAYDIHDARDKAAFNRRWGYEAWVEQQLIVEPPAPPPWERVS